MLWGKRPLASLHLKSVAYQGKVIDRARCVHTQQSLAGQNLNTAYRNNKNHRLKVTRSARERLTLSPTR